MNKIIVIILMLCNVLFASGNCLQIGKNPQKTFSVKSLKKENSYILKKSLFKVYAHNLKKDSIITVKNKYPQAPQFTDLTENSLNRALHFALELGVWSAFGAWGYEAGSGTGKYVLMLGLPLATIVSWTIFAVPNDPWLPGGRNGTQPMVPVPGWLRFSYEIAVHGLAIWAMNDLGWDIVKYAMAGGTVLHYSISFQRIKWLFERK